LSIILPSKKKKRKKNEGKQIFWNIFECLPSSPWFWRPTWLRAHRQHRTIAATIAAWTGLASTGRS